MLKRLKLPQAIKDFSLNAHHQLLFGLAIAAAAMLVSCSAPKNITYMQGYSEGATQAVAEQRRITVQADDKLSIVVSSKDPAAAEVFNLAIAQVSCRQCQRIQQSPDCRLYRDPRRNNRLPYLG